MVKYFLILICIFWALSSWTQQPAPAPAPVPSVPTAVSNPSGSSDQAVTAPPNSGQQELEPNLLSQLIPPFIYQQRNRRDPFSIPIVEKPLEELPDHGPFLPLQKVALSEIEVKAILWDVNKPRAIVKAPDGQLHTLKLSDRVGNQNGYVATIREGEIVIVETVEQDGKVLSSTKVLTLSN